MSDNAVRLDKFCIGNMVEVMEDLERRAEDLRCEKSYAEILAEAREGIEKTSPQDMTLDEYKEYIESKLQNIGRHYTRHRDNVTIVISDSGYQAMQRDSEYEAWVIETVKKDLSCPDYLCGYPGTYGRNEVIQFGATREEYRGQSYAISKNDSRNTNEEESYWSRRLDRLKARLKAEQEWFEHEQILKSSSDEYAQLEAIRRAEEALTNPEMPEIPITGVPANFLLSMLTTADKK
ncbi:MAG: hypothetical protein K6G55_03955 [Selenomonadaceae bacterium]|nr:hypothetical protein [Selenomonadaceae bacterium]